MNSSPIKLGAVGLAVLVPKHGHHTSFHGVTKYRMRETLVPQYSVIDGVATRQGRVQARQHTPLRCSLDTVQGLPPVNIPSVGQGFGINLLATLGLNMPKA